jgi:CheY-like chemotaxis protein
MNIMEKKLIMVVDDEEDIRELLGAVLEKGGYDILVAVDGQECLNKLKKTKPDLILLDMMMPGMSGREVAEQIRKNPDTKNIKIIFVTVARFSELGKDALSKLNVSDYITKPFDNDELLARVKQTLG